MAEVDARRAAAPDGSTDTGSTLPVRSGGRICRPRSVSSPCRQGLAFFTYTVVGNWVETGETASLRELLDAGVLEPEPVVDEDFLPRSAAGDLPVEPDRRGHPGRRPARHAVRAAVRQDDLLRALGPPAHRELAPARGRRRDLGIQLPGRGLRLEHRAPLIAGDTVVWKPAEATPLSALAIDALLARAVRDVGAPEGLHRVLLGDRAVGHAAPQPMARSSAR